MISLVPLEHLIANRADDYDVAPGGVPNHKCGQLLRECQPGQAPAASSVCWWSWPACSFFFCAAASLNSHRRPRGPVACDWFLPGHEVDS
jgi:hypothetical protein